jgi:hypothetical protein
MFISKSSFSVKRSSLIQSFQYVHSCYFHQWVCHLHLKKSLFLCWQEAEERIQFKIESYFTVIMSGFLHLYFMESLLICWPDSYQKKKHNFWLFVDHYFVIYLYLLTGKGMCNYIFQYQGIKVSIKRFWFHQQWHQIVLESKKFTLDSLKSFLLDMKYPLLDKEVEVDKSIWHLVSLSHSEFQLQRGFSEILDKHRDGVLSYAEFSVWWKQPQRYKALKSSRVQ